MTRRTLSREQKNEWRQRTARVLALVGALLIGGVVAGLANAGWPQRTYWDIRMVLVAQLVWPQKIAAEGTLDVTPPRFF